MAPGAIDYLRKREIFATWCDVSDSLPHLTDPPGAEIPFNHVFLCSFTGAARWFLSDRCDAHLHAHSSGPTLVLRRCGIHAPWCDNLDSCAIIYGCCPDDTLTTRKRYIPTCSTRSSKSCPFSHL